jgi:putative ABC transport system substrate-binding protein
MLLGGLVLLGLVGPVLLIGCGLTRSAPRVPQVGYLSAGTPESAAPVVEAFRQGLRDHGYVEGETIQVKYRYAEGRNERSPELAADLAAQPVDVIVTTATPATLAAMRATDTIPIVFVSVGDPVGQGIVCSLTHPCGNVTGLSNPVGLLNGKRLQLLKELLDDSGLPLRRVAILRDADNPASQGPLSPGMSAPAAALGLDLQVVVAEGASGLPAAFDQMSQGGAEAFLETGCPMTCTNAPQVAHLATQHRLPGIYQFKHFVAAGGLISYGSNDRAMFRRIGGYVDKILKGARPADLPVEEPTSFDLVVNQTTAQALGLWPLPPTIQAQVTEVVP